MNKPKKTSFSSKLIQILLKQTAAVIVLTFIISVMYASKISFLKNSSNALGQAIRYEIDLNEIKEHIEGLGIFPADEVTNQ